MDEYEKIRQRKREEYRKRHRAQVRRKQLISNGIVIGMIILIIARSPAASCASLGRSDAACMVKYIFLNVRTCMIRGILSVFTSTPSGCSFVSLTGI